MKCPYGNLRTLGGISYTGNNAPPTSYRLPNKRSQLLVWDMSPLAVSTAQETPKIIKTVAIVPGGPPELNGKTPLLNIPYLLVTGVGEIKHTYLETSTLLASFHSTGRYLSEYRR